MKKAQSADVVRGIQIVLPATVLFVASVSTNKSPARYEDFSLFREKRLQVVEFAKDKELDSPHPLVVFETTVPDVVAGDDIYVFRKDGEYLVFFPTLPYMIDNHAGFVYSESGKVPPYQSFYEVTYIERLDENWFWIRTT